MSAATASSARRSRWAISFADLLLLLLGFFVMLQASGQRKDAMLAQVRAQFGGRAAAQATEIRAAELFQPGEAMLTPAGDARLKALGARFAKGRERLEVSSRGSDSGRQRFDGWDLAAARLGAVARALKDAGVGRDRLAIRGLDQLDGESGKGQMLRIVAGEATR
ncbi:flagellar motor protein MotB [Sphingobium chungbukense]|uniref:Flagellar motor protein n=1 Tax=Sphingobium chungbukense TaxID=56193 RepID=A0A0M3ATG8_9SPHN|nr:flagellar motor protein MotB [Sphingobium chungbukense]KKW93492.1 flagellar motor protein [Sphingobium chungbukense]